MEEKLGHQFLTKREVTGKSCRELAAAAGVPEEDVWRAESGNCRVELGALVSVARVLGCRLELVDDPVQRLINEVTEGSEPTLDIVASGELDQETEKAQRPAFLERINGLLMLKGTGLSVKQLLKASSEGLSHREIAAGTAISRRVIREALRELADKVDQLPIE